MSPNHSPSHTMPSRSSTGPVESHRVSMLGGPGVGKTALISQFCTSECINAYEDTGERIRMRYFFSHSVDFRSLDECDLAISVRWIKHSGCCLICICMCIQSISSIWNSTESTVEQNISVVLNGEESELKFLISQKGSKVSAMRTCQFASKFNLNIIIVISFIHRRNLRRPTHSYWSIRWWIRPRIPVLNNCSCNYKMLIWFARDPLSLLPIKLIWHAREPFLRKVGRNRILIDSKMVHLLKNA